MAQLLEVALRGVVLFGLGTVAEAALVVGFICMCASAGSRLVDKLINRGVGK